MDSLHSRKLQEDMDAPPPYEAEVSTAHLCKTLAKCVPPPPVPVLNIVIQVVGSRGDVQPFVALGQELRQHGHRVRIATHNTFDKFVRDSGLEFYPIGGDPAELMAYMVKNPGLIPSMKSLKAGDIQRKRSMVAEMLDGCWRSCIDADPTTAAPFVADAIIANPPSFAHIHCAQALGVPVQLMFTMPWSNTRAFPHPLASIVTKNTAVNPEIVNYISYSVVEWMTWQGLGDVINEWRASIDLEPVPLSEGPGLARTLEIPFTYCWSPALVPKPADWPSYIDVCGFFFRSPPEYSPDPELADFLANGPPPIYIGFGSIVIDEPDRLTAMILKAVRATGVRAIISKGWSDLGGRGQLQFQDENVNYLGDCPHEWLFQNVAAVVHHGGAGTTACGLVNGRPTFIVPFFGDQPFWGDMVGAAGAGPSPVFHKLLTAEKLAEAIKFCMTPDAVNAAQDLASRMKMDSGVASAVQSFHNNLPNEKLRCDLLPTESASWTYETPKGRLKISRLAAEVLSDRLKISPRNLQPHHTNSIIIETRRWDPVSASTSAAMTMSADLVRDTVNIVKMPVQAYQKSRTKLDAASTAADSSLPAEIHPPHSTNRSSVGSSGVPIPYTTNSRNCMSAIGLATSASIGGVSKLVGHCTRATYVDVPLAITEGLRAVPKFYGGAVRDYGHVTDWKSGFSKAGKHMVFGIADGLVDLCMEPVVGGRKEGGLGVMKGVGKGLVSITTKVSSAALGIVAYPGQGIYQSIRTTVHSHTRQVIAQARREEGVYRSKNLVDRKAKTSAILAAFESFRSKPS
ncbi:hypothetical protein BKA67DRAFT_591502 [Truncatella angustata]|uniref:Glycosyltransferase family 28 N-terminal domain-containing protein n=1 Tax=Truncatella angustata TaxID=152316 RepID=A0A9P8UV71_9PEZI|nr:uncharacterized protein BKA67DRAFT_591502 [Truncatella angustata]KAH6658657.1 hypothetical protein BKA67DRAFT_591502 [Truncatella angustata]